MFVPDVPPEAPEPAPAMMIVQSHVEDDKHRTIGFCEVVENLAEPYTDSHNDLSPVFDVGSYFEWFEDTQLGSNGKVTLLEGPKHGVLEVKGENSWNYLPSETDYLGVDSVTYLVEMDGYTVQLTYGIKAVDFIDGGHQGATVHESPENCPHGKYWKISPDGEITPLQLEEDDDEFQALENHLQNTLATNQFNLSFDDLLNGALGEANQDTITLDNNANGYGWYIDLTPGLNEEYLPTSNPYEWKAKPGSEAEGKIDMLTVLLHEAAHTLGHDHTLDSYALMASTLEPGVRRLPSPELLAELQGLAEQYVALNEEPTPLPNPLPFVGFSALWMGRMRKTDFGYLLEAVGANNDRDIQYAVTPNPTLLNPEFNAVDGWNATGDVVLGGNAAVLTESTRSQTRLNQLFTLGTSDRFLRFTLDGIQLDDVNAAPDDAFEFALIDANTNQSLLGGNGLTRSDATINLQADGTEHLARVGIIGSGLAFCLICSIDNTTYPDR